MLPAFVSPEIPDPHRRLVSAPSAPHSWTLVGVEPFQQQPVPATTGETVVVQKTQKERG